MTSMPGSEWMPSLLQGQKFNTNQSKYIPRPSNVVEGFEDGTTTNTTPTTNTSTNVLLQEQAQDPENILASESSQIVEDNQQTEQEIKTLEELRQEYEATLKEFQDLTNKISVKQQEFLKRTTNNPYANRLIKFTGGEIAYVTNQGVVKPIPKNLLGEYSNNYTNVGILWDPTYNIPGTKIGEFPLISGVAVTSKESKGNAGKNVFVNRKSYDKNVNYIGCYNDRRENTYILIVPSTMNKTNSASGFSSSASSTYSAGNDGFGPWAAFNYKDDPYWHSSDKTGFLYDANTGVYKGNTSLNVIGRTSGSIEKGTYSVKGEWLKITCPKPYVLTKYFLKGRQGCCGNPNGRDPCEWAIYGCNNSQNCTLVDYRNGDMVGRGLQNVVVTKNGGLEYINYSNPPGESLDPKGNTYYVNNTTAYDTYLMIITKCGNPGNKGNRYCVQISQWNLYTTTDFTATDTERAMGWGAKNIGYTDLDTCKSYALENNYAYFGLQDGKQDGKSLCLVSNELANSQKYGKAADYKPIALWSTKTQGTGYYASLTGGSLVVISPTPTDANKVVWASPAKKATNYIGCYGDSKNRAMSWLTNGSQSDNYDSCLTGATSKGFKYFALQNSGSGNNAQCSVSNDINSIKKYGLKTNCTKTSNGTWSGGGWSNAVYSLLEENDFYLELFDSGFVIRRGTPTNYQGDIWSWSVDKKTTTLGSNPNFAADKGKYGKNWIANGSTLQPGEFVGSPNGSVYLMMQSDGNLVLYTSEKKNSCKTSPSGNYQVGESWVNAIYRFMNPWFPDNVNKVAYLDENEVLHEYPSDNIQMSNSYTIVSKMDTPGNDLPGAAYGSATKDKCETTCNNNKSCYGYVFDRQNNVCYPKSSGMNSGTWIPVDTLDTYIRGREPITPPAGVSSTTINIDSTKYEYYNSGGEPDARYGLSIATEAEQAQLELLEQKLTQQSNAISDYINQFGDGMDNSQYQSDKNLQGLDQYQTELQQVTEQNANLQSTSTTSEGFTTNYGYTTNNNIDKILSDSDIIVLQKNYDYLFWSILAASSVIVAMNIKKQ